MKIFILLVLLFVIHFSTTAQKNSDNTYFYIDNKDRFMQVQYDSYLYIFLDEAGLREKQYKDSIYLGLASPYKTDSDGKIIFSDDSIPPGMSYNLIDLDTSIDQRSFENANIITREEFLALPDGRKIRKTLIKDKNCDEYKVVKLIPIVRE